MGSRSERLLELLQLLRRCQRPVAGDWLARELGISLRSLYRDIASLRGQGAPIDGEPGLGYVLRPGFVLPPLMLDAEEIEALVLGARWVRRNGDPALALAADNAVAKISAVLPAEARRLLEHHTLLVATPAPLPIALVDAPQQIRTALRQQRKLRLDYADEHGRRTRRTVWPFALGFFDQVRMLAAWCELRDDFRHFRLDRLHAIDVLPDAMPRHRLALLRQWKAGRGIDPA